MRIFLFLLAITVSKLMADNGPRSDIFPGMHGGDNEIQFWHKTFYWLDSSGMYEEKWVGLYGRSISNYPMNNIEINNSMPVYKALSITKTSLFLASVAALTGGIVAQSFYDGSSKNKIRGFTWTGVLIGISLTGIANEIESQYYFKKVKQKMEMY